MLPNPLHPAVVHFPVVLAFLVPLFVAGAVWAIRRGANARRAWALPLGAAIALAVSAWVAVQTGEAQDERVERVVSEQAIESHEELAEGFLAASAGVAAIALVGLVGGAAGRTARVLTGVGAVALVVMVARVGHSGGQLVYKYGAANAYAAQSGPGTDSARAAPRNERPQRDRRGDDDR